MKRLSQHEVDAQLAALESQEAPALRQRWLEVYGCPAPARIRADLLRRAVAYRIQEQAFGGLRPATLRRLKGLANRAEPGAPSTAGRVVLRPGVRLMREWNGDTHSVEVVVDGFRWRGMPYSSLSCVARAITGARWSGPRFFGLTQEQSAKPSGSFHE